MKRVVRVFPYRTNCTPTDDLTYCGNPFLWTEADEVKISVVFSWQIPEAERLEKEWRYVAPTEIGGPAVGTKGEDFIPGMFMSEGNVITSRGCNNKCWFCKVWQRDGTVRELPITDGWRLQDDNLLACSEQHIKGVFDMLGRQKNKAEFAGGIEAKLLKAWHVDLFAKLKPAQIFCAYDTPDDLEPLIEAGKMFINAGLQSALRAFVLIGHPRDTISLAEKRMKETYSAGFLPFAMLWRDDEDSGHPQEWKQFQRMWCRPAITRKLCKNQITEESKLT